MIRFKSEDSKERERINEARSFSRIYSSTPHIELFEYPYLSLVILEPFCISKSAKYFEIYKVKEKTIQIPKVNPRILHQFEKHKIKEKDKSE